MGPYDIAVVIEDYTVVVHKIYAGTDDEVVGSIRALYKDTIIRGIIFGAEG